MKHISLSLRDSSSSIVRGDRGRVLIDTVRKKGDAASSEMIRFLCELDPFLSEHLGLM
uniref:CARD domain-containing protein n=1 Tax=Poecilia reticulata TaxID=8081 RepID=A0A3P9P1V3_POERE